jgi:hypothetical protein
MSKYTTKSPKLKMLAPLLIAIAIWALLFLLIELGTGLISGREPNRATLSPTSLAVLGVESPGSESANASAVATRDTQSAPLSPDNGPSSPGDCTVPDLIGTDDNSASYLLNELGLRPIRMTMYDAHIRAGAVASQDPRPGHYWFRVLAV